MRFTISALLIWSLVGCGPSPTHPSPRYLYEEEPELEPDFHPNVDLREQIGRIRFDNSVPAEDYLLIAKDLHRLSSVAVNSEMRQVLDLSDSSPASLVGWLEDRVQFILANTYKHSGLGVEAGADNYGLMMFKMYLDHPGMAREREIIPGVGEVVINSPRVGMIRLGPSFFAEKTVKGAEISKSIIRLGELFHEARHSDGNGTSLGFVHSKCPSGHPEAGISNCDNHSNGAYKVSAIFMQSALDGCTKCSRSGAEIVRLYIAGSLSRVLPGSTPGDDAPQGMR
jgi:hypothetical protein